MRLEALDPEKDLVEIPSSRAAELARLEGQCLERWARFSRMALDVGVAEPRVRMAERQAQVIAAAFGNALDKHSLGAERQGRQLAELVRLFGAKLELLEAGRTTIHGTVIKS